MAHTRPERLRPNPRPELFIARGRSCIAKAVCRHRVQVLVVVVAAALWLRVCPRCADCQPPETVRHTGCSWLPPTAYCDDGRSMDLPSIPSLHMAACATRHTSHGAGSGEQGERSCCSASIAAALYWSAVRDGTESRRARSDRAQDAS